MGNKQSTSIKSTEASVNALPTKNQDVDIKSEIPITIKDSTKTGGGCPMRSKKKDENLSTQMEGFLSAAVSPVSPTDSSNNKGKIIMKEVETKCPITGMKQKKMVPVSVGDTPGNETVIEMVNEGGGCPIKGKNGSKDTKKVYNVYAQEIDPTNHMPSSANQQPAPGQKQSLSTDRVNSNIPKGGTDSETWTYPSPQMFWNALVRKGKVEGAEETDMEAVVAIHNNMNENTWKAVLAWESLHDKQNQVRLSRFMGRPYDLSPKAMLRSWLGQGMPFDRHDWYVDRGDGEGERRYVIDYYHDDVKAKENQLPTLNDSSAVKSIAVDVRPAIDSFDAILDRIIYMPWEIYVQKAKNLTYVPPPLFRFGFKLSDDKEALQRPEAKNSTAKMNDKNLNDLEKEMKQKCKNTMLKVRDCKSDIECTTAAIAHYACIGEIICPQETKTFQKFYLDDSNSNSSDENDKNFELALESMSSCVENFSAKLASNKEK